MATLHDLYSSAARAGSSVTSSMIPPYPGSVARARDRVQALQAYFQQPTNSPPMRTPPLVSSTRRPTPAHRGLTQLGPVAPLPDHHTNGFYFFPSGSSTTRNFSEPRPMEREHLPSFPPGPVHQPGGGSSDTNIRPTGFRPRHGSERMMQSHNWSLWLLKLLVCVFSVKNYDQLCYELELWESMYLLKKWECDLCNGYWSLCLTGQTLILSVMHWNDTLYLAVVWIVWMGLLLPLIVSLDFW